MYCAYIYGTRLALNWGRFFSDNEVVLRIRVLVG